MMITSISIYSKRNLAEQRVGEAPHATSSRPKWVESDAERKWWSSAAQGGNTKVVAETLKEDKKIMIHAILGWKSKFMWTRMKT